MNSALKIKTLLGSLSFALIAAAPLVRAQDAAPAAAPSAAAPAAAPDTPPPAADAPPPRRGKGKGKGMPNALDSVSNVTADQKAAAKKIQEAARAKVMAIPQDDDDRMSKMMAIRKDASAQVRALLTPDQQTEYDAAVKKMMRRGKKKAPDGDAGAPPPPPPQN